MLTRRTIAAGESTSGETSIQGQFEAFRDGQIHLLEQLAAGVPLPRALEAVVRMIQEQSPGTIASVLLLGPDGVHLHHGAAPDLPAEYNEAINGTAIGPKVGSCGTAAFHGRRVIVSDIATDPLWADFKDLALSRGLRSCWSEPILDSQGKVLGTFAMYHRYPSTPSEEDLRIIRVAAHLAGIAIERQRTEAARRRAERERDQLERAMAEQRHADEARRASEELAQATLDAISANICVIDGHGAIQSVNQAWLAFAAENHLVHRAGEWPNYLAVCDAAGGKCEQAAAFAEGLRAVMRGELPEFSMEYPCHTPTEQRWFLARATRFASGQPLRLVVVHENITARRRAEERLRARDEQIRLLISGLKDYGIFALDPAGRVVSWNVGAERLKGYRAEEILGQHFECFYPPEDRARGKPQQELEVAAREGRVEDEGWRVRKDGSRFWANVVISALKDETGKLRGFSKVTRDITERKQADDELKRTLAELARSNAELEQFAYVASHDLQEPLRAVAGCAEILEKEYGPQLDAHAGELIHHTVEGAWRMQTLIHDLLAYSRVGTRGQPFQPTDCNAALQQAVLNLSTALQESNAVITHDPLPTLPADPTQLPQLFQNLIGNGIKFRAGRRPEIHVGAQPQEDGWLFSVRDNGIGIEPQYRERIFVIFQRLHTRTEYPGTGIGLAICKRIVERHGGKIWVESEPGQGATFYFTIAGKGAPAGT